MSTAHCYMRHRCQILASVCVADLCSFVLGLCLDFQDKRGCCTSVAAVRPLQDQEGLAS